MLNAPTGPRWGAQAAQLRAWLPGTALAGVIALAASFVAALHGGPQLLYALFFGVAFNYLSHEPRTKPGIEFASRTLLRLAVGLLGARITLAQIQSLGWPTAAIVVSAVAGTVLLGVLLARRMGLGAPFGMLSGGSVAICGASAALAISAVLPRNPHNDRQTLMVVVSVTVLSTLAMLLYPLLARTLQLPPELAGLFIGGSIHDVAQVVGAGYMLGQQTGDVATIVKLFRVSLLALVVVAAGLAFGSAWAQRRAAAAAPAADPVATAASPAQAPARPPLVPWFLWLFVAMVAANSMGWLPAPVQQGLGGFSRACLVVAIAALGTKTSFTQLRRAGWRPLSLILVETAWIALWVLGWAVWRAHAA